MSSALRWHQSASFVLSLKPLPACALVGFEYESAKTMIMNEIQSIFFPDERFKQDLYFVMFHKREIMYDGIEVKDGSIILENKGHISTNSYFNSFYESYWTKYTSIRKFFLKIKFEGVLSIKVYRDEPGLGARLIKTIDRLHHENMNEMLLEIPSNYTSAVKGSAGRIFFDFKAHSKSELSEISICTEESPERSVNLTLGICTFSRESYLAATIRSISSCEDLENIISNVIIVNQGPPFSNSELIQSIGSDRRIKVIEQDNFGGCGGFTRSLMEAVNFHGEANYHLLMDDDIVLDPRVIINCANFIRYSDKENVVGGSMLDSHRPHMLYEAGACLKKNNVIQSVMRNVDVGDPVNLSELNRPVAVDFNAWWFCAIPLSALRDVKYPAPIFIRGDDFEFGIRLAKNGYETVSLPGVAVWHEPFYAKPPGWQQYYDLRNRLIFAACHDDMVKIQSPNHLLRHALLEPLLTHNYQMLNLNIKAIEDFLLGPDALFAVPSQQKHSEVMSLYAKERAEVLSRQEAAGFDSFAYEVNPLPRRDIKLAYVVKLLKSLLWKSSSDRPKGILLDVNVGSTSVGNRSYIMTNGPRSFFLLFSPNRQKLFYYLRCIFKINSRYKSEMRRATGLWKNSISQWRESDTWEKIFSDGAAVSDPIEYSLPMEEGPPATRRQING